MREFRLCGYVDCPIEDSSGFNVYVGVHATNEDEAWEKLFAMTPEQFKKEAEPFWENDAYEKVWVEEVGDANDGIDWYFDDVTIH